MTNQINRAVSQHEFVWGPHMFRQVGPAFEIVAKQFTFRGINPYAYVWPWQRFSVDAGYRDEVGRVEWTISDFAFGTKL